MLLEARNVTRMFGTKSAVDNVSFTVPKAGFIGIIGRSGAGKSTFLRMMNRLTDATSGELLFEGRNILTLAGKEKRAWQGQCAMIFQQFNLVPRADVVSNVLHGTLARRGMLPSMFGFWPDDDTLKALAILDRLGIAEQAPKRAEALSGGQQQRVAIARALVSDPRILICDEPTGDLDRKTADEVLTLLQQLNREFGKTIVMVTHDPKAAEYAKRTVHLDKGSLVAEPGH
jgi:phosphonate transport system ATP-binding protein